MFHTTVLLLLLCWLMVILSPVSGFVPPTSTTEPPRSRDLAVFGLAGDMARRLGKLVGGSEWKQISDSFQEGFEESQINARARNAKPMEALPPELPSLDSTIATNTQQVVESGHSTILSTPTREVVDVQVERKQEENDEKSKQ